MKLSFFGIVAVLASQTWAQYLSSDREYTIRATGTGLFLTDHPDAPLSFESRSEDANQIWTFGGTPGYIQSVATGGYVNCPDPGNLCWEGSERQYFEPLRANDGRYLFVQDGAPYRLYRTDNNVLDTTDRGLEDTFFFEIEPVFCESDSPVHAVRQPLIVR